jgi:hypothetical protein
MNAPTVVSRDGLGRILPGNSGNPAGRPKGAISEFRAFFDPRMPEVAETLLALMRSPNEATRLAACREILDRLIGRPQAQVNIDAVTTRVDVAELYRRAMVRANEGRGAGEINGSAGEKEIQ